MKGQGHRALLEQKCRGGTEARENEQQEGSQPTGGRRGDSEASWLAEQREDGA